MDDARKFGIADGMVLIAGVAAGLGMVRVAAPGVSSGNVWAAFARPSQGWSVEYAIGLFSELGIFIGVPLLASWTPACLLVQFLKPRPTWRRLRRRPGFVACLVPSLVGGITAAMAWLLGRSGNSALSKALIVGGFASGLLVACSWATMKFCGAWRARPTWVDRLGRLTGIGWIVLGAMGAISILWSLD